MNKHVDHACKVDTLMMASVLQMLEQGSHPVLAVKSARVGDFNGKTLSTLNTSLVSLDPDIPEAGMLRNW